MQKLIAFSIITLSSIMLSACGESEYDKCKQEASQHWDSNASGNSRADNPKYWNAIDKCKEKHK